MAGSTSSSSTARPITDPTPKGTIPQKTGPEYWNRLYHQKADGTFEDITEKAGLQGIGYGMGVAVADYDNDGYEDLFVTGYGGNHLYHNNGNCTFTDVTDKAGVGGGGWSTSAAWVDLDNDGLLDLVVDRYVTWDWDDVWCGEHREGYRGYLPPRRLSADHHARLPQRRQRPLHRGLAQAGPRQSRQGAGHRHCRLRSRRPHPTSSSPTTPCPSSSSTKRGDGTFEEVGLESGVAVDGEGRTFAGMGVDFADYDNDGCPDLVVTDLANQQYALYQQQPRRHLRLRISYRPGSASMTLLHSGWSLRFLDYDNDGWKDLLIAQGHDLDTIEKSYPAAPLSRADAAGAERHGKSFVDVSAMSGEVFHEAGWAAAWPSATSTTMAASMLW